MKTFTLGTRYTINDLKTAKILMDSMSRDYVKILVIDDEDFLYKEELHSRGFNLNYLDDLQNLDLVSAYPIIISDIRGVGKSMKMDNEGASLIVELKKKYPLKIIAAYSGSTFDATYNNYLAGVTIIKKDAKLDEWTSYLDRLIEKVTNPIEKWCTLRDYLISREVDLFELAKLEHEYVDVVLNKDKDFSNFPSKSIKKEINPELIKTIASIAINLALK